MVCSYSSIPSFLLSRSSCHTDIDTNIISLMDPSTHRLPTSTLAQQTHGHCLSVRYRLSPQHPFPSALLDAFVAYLSLVSPPTNSFHSSVPPAEIVLAGDSSGANLAASLLLLLLTLPKLGIKKLMFHGK